MTNECVARHYIVSKFLSVLTDYLQNNQLYIQWYEFM